jgi:hypothetical protein
MITMLRPGMSTKYGHGFRDVLTPVESGVEVSMVCDSINSDRRIALCGCTIRSVHSRSSEDLDHSSAYPIRLISSNPAISKLASVTKKNFTGQKMKIGKETVKFWTSFSAILAQLAGRLGCEGFGNWI